MDTLEDNRRRGCAVPLVILAVEEHKLWQHVVRWRNLVGNYLYLLRRSGEPNKKAKKYSWSTDQLGFIHLLYYKAPQQVLAQHFLTCQFHKGNLPAGSETAGHHSRKTIVREGDFMSPFLYTSILCTLVMLPKCYLKTQQQYCGYLWTFVTDRFVQWKCKKVNILYNSLVNYVLRVCVKNFKTIKLSLTKLRPPVVLEIIWMLAGHVCNATTTTTWQFAKQKTNGSQWQT